MNCPVQRSPGWNEDAFAKEGGVGLLGGVITLGALVLVQVNPTSLRGFIGSDAGWGNMFLTLIAALFYSMLIVVGMMLESGPGGAGARES